jgi:hypothetical protein
MTRALSAFSYGHGGLGVCLIALAAGYFLPASRLSDRKAKVLLLWLSAVVCAAMITELFLTTEYLFSPAYLDHIEASVASNVHALLGGQPLYPPLDSYTFGGLLYGPLLAELNSLGYLLLKDSLAAKLIGWLAGWSAVIVLVLQTLRRGRGIASVVALSYSLCFLVSFGADLTVDRSEPLLLLFATGSLAIALNFKGLPGLMLLGLLCGGAMGLKVHAGLYLVPSLYLWARGLTPGFCGAAAVALVLPCLPENVSLAGFLRYLTLAAKHGLSSDLFSRNCVFLLGLWAPILLLRPARSSIAGRRLLRAHCALTVGPGRPSRPPVRRMRRTPRDGAHESDRLRGFAITLFASECVVLILASKPGAGIHHFIPFLAAHVILFQDVYAPTAAAAPGRAALALLAAVLGMVTPTFQSFSSLVAFDMHLPEQKRQRDELLGFATRFPQGMLGVSGDNSYELTNFRPWLTARGVSQTDYGAFMDLELSGVSDEPLRSALQRCAIPFVYIPKPGEPFTVTSYYRGRPLFSDTLRQQFAWSYRRVESGIYFDVFACRPG